MQGRYVGESDWGLEANPVNVGGMALRIATAEAIRVHPFLRALYADRLGPARDAPALVGPEEGRAVRSALSEWSLALLEPLLELGGCDLDAPGGVFERTALHLALMHTNLPAALALVRAGARLDVPDIAGNTALHYAARSGLPAAPLLEAAGLSATGAARAQSQRSKAGLQPSEMGAPPSEAGGQAEPARANDAGSDGGWAQGVPVRHERCQIEVMDAAEFGPASFAPYISGQRPLLVRGLADKVAPRLVRDWAKEPFVHKFGSLRFNTSTVGYAEMLRLPTEELSVAEFVARISDTGATSEAQPYIFANDFLRTHPELSGLHELLGEGHRRPVIQPPWMVGLPAWAGYNERDAQDASAVSQRHLLPYFLGHFSPVLRSLFAVLLRFPASWRQDGENGRKMA